MLAMNNLYKSVIFLPVVLVLFASCATRNPDLSTSKSKASDPVSNSKPVGSSKGVVKAPAKLEKGLEKLGFSVEVVQPKSDLRATANVLTEASGSYMENCSYYAYSDFGNQVLVNTADQNGFVSPLGGRSSAGPMKEPSNGEKLGLIVGPNDTRVDFVTIEDFMADPAYASWNPNGHLIVLFCEYPSRILVSEPSLSSSLFQEFADAGTLDGSVNFDIDYSTCTIQSPYFETNANGRDLSGLTNGDDLSKYSTMYENISPILFGGHPIWVYGLLINSAFPFDNAALFSPFLYTYTSWTADSIKDARWVQSSYTTAELTCTNRITSEIVKATDIVYIPYLERDRKSVV